MSRDEQRKRAAKLLANISADDPSALPAWKKARSDPRARLEGVLGPVDGVLGALRALGPTDDPETNALIAFDEPEPQGAFPRLLPLPVFNLGAEAATHAPQSSLPANVEQAMTAPPGAQAARPAAAVKRRRRPPLEKKIAELTARQIEVVQVAGECKQNFAEAGRRLGIDRKTVKQHWDAAMKKLSAAGIPTPARSLKTATRRLSESRRGEVDAFKDEDGQNRPGSAWRTGRRQDED